jgi:predicted transport protein
MILKYFATEALKVRTQNPMDINICMMALNSERIEREMISYYIAYRLEEEYMVLSNTEIHKKLVVILNKIKRESVGFRKTGRVTSKIILD